MRMEKEFGAHTWGICSTHEYYKTVEFQLQTPTRSGRTRKSLPSQVHMNRQSKMHAYIIVYLYLGKMFFGSTMLIISFTNEFIF